MKVDVTKVRVAPQEKVSPVIKVVPKNAESTSLNKDAKQGAAQHVAAEKPAVKAQPTPEPKVKSSDVKGEKVVEIFYQKPKKNKGASSNVQNK